MNTNKILPLVALLLAGACGPQTPVGTFVYTYTDPPPDMARVSRLSVETKDGITTVRDHLMGDEPCVWLLNKACEPRCFPVEPLYPACNGEGEILYYTRQLLSTKFSWGRVETAQDPACQGRATNQLYALEFIPKGERHTPIFVCQNRNQSLEPSLYDRNWYRVKITELLPASAADLPAESK